MSTVQCWTGREARALRLALRATVRGFAEHLGVEPRTVSKWEQRSGTITLLPDSQTLLDTALRQTTAEVRERFTLSLQDGTSQAGQDRTARYNQQTRYNPGAEADTNRRDATKLLGLALTSAGTSASLPAVDALEQLFGGQQPTKVDRQLIRGHQEVATTIAGLYCSGDARIALPVALSYAEEIFPLLAVTMNDTFRTDLVTVIAGLHASRSTYGYGMKEHLDSVRGFAFALAGAEAEAERCVIELDEYICHVARQAVG